MLSIDSLKPSQAVHFAEANARSARLKKIGFTLMMLLLTVMLALFPDVAFAAGGGLTQAKTGLTNFIAEIQPLIRIVAVIAIIGAGIGYMMNMVDKSLFIKIIVGIIIIASANEIVNFFWTSNGLTGTV